MGRENSGKPPVVSTSQAPVGGEQAAVLYGIDTGDPGDVLTVTAAPAFSGGLPDCLRAAQNRSSRLQAITSRRPLSSRTSSKESRYPSADTKNRG